MGKAIAIGYLAKVSAGNINASHTEGNVMVAKKVTLPDGTTAPYISGQALRRMLRDRLEELGYQLSEPFATVSGQEVTPPVRPWDFIDEDLFGYLDPSGGNRRTSPVRVSAAIGLFPFYGDRDLGTRSFEKFGEKMEAGGNMFETEIYNNLFRGSLLLELDRIGIFPATEHKEHTDQQLDAQQRIQRVQAVLEALKLLWGGGRTARMLSDLSPRFFAYSRLNVKHPVFLEALSAQYDAGQYWLDTAPLTNVLQKFQQYRITTIFGIDPGVFANEAEIREALEPYGTLQTVHEAIELAKQDVQNGWNLS